MVEGGRTSAPATPLPSSAGSTSVGRSSGRRRAPNSRGGRRARRPWPRSGARREDGPASSWRRALLSPSRTTTRGFRATSPWSRSFPRRSPAVAAIGEKRHLALLHLATQGDEVHAGAAALREHLGVLLDDVVGDVLAQHLDLRIVVIVVRVGGFDLRDQLLRRCVLDVGLVEQVGFDSGAARRRDRRSPPRSSCAPSACRRSSARAPGAARQALPSWPASRTA